MTAPIFWPVDFYYEPIGSTAASCLTRDLPPEASANILLLNCTDCRNVLFTAFCESTNPQRNLDFTCSDVDPGILARAAILMAMAADGIPPHVVWNIFFHLHLDEDTFSRLVAHCRKLSDLARTSQDWNCSQYGPLLHFGTEHTRSEVRRCLNLYAADTASLLVQESPPEVQDDEDAPRDVRKHDYQHCSARSAGPMHKEAKRVFDEAFKIFQETGMTFTDEGDIAAATHLNPTFYYSRHGPASTLHPCVDPLTPFHPAPLFGDRDPESVSVMDLVQVCRQEFGSWCSSIRAVHCSQERRIAIRLILGDPLVVTRALEEFGRAKVLDSGTPVSSWTMQPMVLSEEEYLHRHAPTTFNVVDTSTLWDTAGMFHILSSVTPLLSVSSHCDSVVYTESLVAWRHDKKTKIPGYQYELFTEIALWFDLCPVDFLTGFSSRYNAHETLVFDGDDHTRRHEVLVWKRPNSGDHLARRNPHPKVIFQGPTQLASQLFAVFTRLFGDLHWFSHLTVHLDTWRRERRINEFLLYTRESYARFLRCARDRFYDLQEWNEVMNVLLSRLNEELYMDRAGQPELWTQLYRLGVDNTDFMHQPTKPKSGRLSIWDTLPPLIRLSLVVPAEKIRNMTTICRCVGNSSMAVSVAAVRGRVGWFQCLNVTFGKAIDVGTESAPQILIEEDEEGIRGHSDMILTFVVGTELLSDLVNVDTGREDSRPLISFFFMICPGRATWRPEDGQPCQLPVFKAGFEDRESVFVEPAFCLPSVNSPWPCAWLARTEPSPSEPMPIGKQVFVQVKVEEEEDDCGQREKISGLTARIQVDNPRLRAALVPGLNVVEIEQVSPCVLRAYLGGYEQDVVYPLPISTDARQRINFTTEPGVFHFDLFMPVAKISFEPGGYKLNPVSTVSSKDGLTFFPWSIHRVNLDRMPIVNLSAPTLNDWLDEHVWSQLSITDNTMKTCSAMRNKREFTARTWPLPKDSIYCILYRPFTTRGRLTDEGAPFRIIALHDLTLTMGETHASDTFIFMNHLRYDLTAHTVVADAYVLTLAPTLTEDLVIPLVGMAGIPVYGGEMRLWKQLLPTLAERCRTWSHGPNCEYKATGRIPLETEASYGDPLCSCGRGKDVEGMSRDPLWAPLKPYVTRIALSPLFPVWYLEPMIRKFLRRAGFVDGAGRPREVPGTTPKCWVCGVMKYELKRCSRCRAVFYCSQKCQREHWPKHKAHCEQTDKESK